MRSLVASFLPLAACLPPIPEPGEVSHGAPTEEIEAPSGPEAASEGAAKTGEAADPPPACADPGLTYEIYVRSFADSDGDGGGDLGGVRAHLDYLDALGVQTIWLMPVFPSFGPAGYDVTDFSTVNPEYGSRAELRALVEDAHERGIHVWLDIPFNHVHRLHPWFVHAEEGRDSPTHGWFDYAPAAEDEDHWFAAADGEAYYAYFGRDMPDLDYDEPEVIAAMQRTWGDWLAEVDGFRLDAVIMLSESGETLEGAPQSHEVLADLLSAAREANPSACFLAEASEWDVASSLSWIGTADLPGADTVLDFPRQDALLAAAAQHTAGPVLDVVQEQVQLGGAGRMVAFLGSHDLERLPTRVPDPSERRALRVLQFLLPGSPVLYYGEELDLPDSTTGTGQDEAMRAPMPWSDLREAGFTTGSAWFPPDPSYLSGLNVAEEAADPGSPLALTQALACARSKIPSENAGSWLPITSLNASLALFLRTTSAGDVEVVVNLSDLPVDAAPGGPLGAWGYRVIAPENLGCPAIEG